MSFQLELNRWDSNRAGLPVIIGAAALLTELDNTPSHSGRHQAQKARHDLPFLLARQVRKGERRDLVRDSHRSRPEEF